MKPRTAPVSESPELDELLRNLDFPVSGVVEAAAQQPRLFLKAAEFHVAKYRRMLAAKAAFESERATRELEIRRKAREDGDKLTEGNISALLLTDSHVAAAQQRFHIAEAEEMASKQLMQAYYQRRDCMDMIARMTSTERAMEKMVETNTAAVKDAKRRLQERYAG